MNRINRIAVTPTVTLNAYTANDVVGGLMTFGVFPQAFDGVIRNLLSVDDDAQSEAYVMYVFESLPSTIANDAAFAPTLADLKKIATTITVANGDYITKGGNTWTQDIVTEEAGSVHSDSGNLYVYAVATNTPDYATTTPLTFTMTVEVF